MVMDDNNVDNYCRNDELHCLPEEPGSMGNALLIYMMAIKDARQRNEANRAFSMGKQHTDCPTAILRITKSTFHPIILGIQIWTG